MRTRAALALAVAFTLAVTLGGCGRLRVPPPEAPTTTTHGDPFPANPTGEWDAILVVVPADRGRQEAVSVDEALIQPASNEPLLVRGALFVDDAYGQVWLCGRAEQNGDAQGPHCGGTVLLVQDQTTGAGMLVSEYIMRLLDAAAVENLQVSGSVRWSADAAVLGRIR